MSGQVVVKRGREKPIVQRHPWIFSGAVARLALRAQGQYVDLVVEAGGEVREDYQAYDARVAVRMAF